MLCDEGVLLDSEETDDNDFDELDEDESSSKERGGKSLS